MGKRLTLKIVFLLVLVFTMRVVVAHYNSLDGLRGFLGSFILEEDTVYAPGYSDRAYKKVKIGMAKNDVFETLGAPLMESWEYAGNVSCLMWFRDDVVCGFYYSFGNKAEEKIEEGIKKADVLKLYGRPYEESWIYSEGRGKSYRMRKVIFRDNKVVEKIHKFYAD